ncbi:Phospholipid-transporting ATPase 3 [Diplonema papillatum]|nr:Phospholipid-transporting ATPase 3 [Diplonema papillatum]
MASGHPDEGAPDHEEPGKRHVVLQDEGSVNNRPPTVRVRQSFAEGDSFVGDGSRDRMRTIHPYDAAANRRYDYPPNFLKTSHYTLLNFLPLNLLKQFVQFSNIYFFVVMVISLFPGISPITPASAVVPLIFVLTVAAVKDGYEDWKRHRADKHDNSALAKVLVGDRWQEVPSMDIQVGDFILLERGPGGEACPVKADVVLVSSADDDGVVYIETSQLDGETNVKPRKARIETQALGQEPEELANASPDLLYTVDHPNPKIYSWHGVLQHALDGNHAAAQKAPLAIKNVIWRGSSMKKTPWAVGLVIYTGRDTKQGRNLKRTIRKMSSLSVKVNKLITGIFIFKHLLLFPLCILSIVWSNEEGGSHWYLADIVNEYEDWEVFFLNYMTYFVLLSFLIPISLFVTVELCKVCQVMLMKYDHQMMHYMKGPGWVGCRPKTSDLNEQLAIVKYVFTDKTGTLTENIMRYVEGAVLASAPAAHEKSWLVHNEVRDPGSINSTTGPGSGAKGDAAGGFQGFPADLGPVSDVGRYLACMALCNAVVPFEDSRTGKVVFEGSSPDEVALVQAAASNHFLLSKRSSRDVCLKIGGGVTDENSSAAAKEHTFEILQDLEFTPTRKMMSVVVRDSEGTILLLTKGADSSVLANLSPAAKSDASLGPGQQLLSSFASKQFRTLCLAWRVVTEQEYDSWSIKFNDVQVSVGRTDEMVDAVCLQLESSLELIGFAAYEDKLQDGVPETIEFLTNSGIVVWMLTGDKLETGIEIGKTCGLAHGTEVVDVHLAREFADDQTLVDKKDDSQEDREARRKRREELCHEKIASASARADELASAKAGPRRITIAIDGPSIDILQSQKEVSPGWLFEFNNAVERAYPFAGNAALRERRSRVIQDIRDHWELRAPENKEVWTRRAQGIFNELEAAWASGTRRRFRADFRRRPQRRDDPGRVRASKAQVCRSPPPSCSPHFVVLCSVHTAIGCPSSAW